MTEQKNNRLDSLSHLLGFLWPFVKVYRGPLIGAVAALVSAAGSVLTIGWALRCLVDYGLSSGSQPVLNLTLLLMLAIVSVLALASAARYYAVAWLGERVMADLRSTLYRHILTLDPGFFDTHKTGNILSRLTTDTTVVQQVVSQSLSVALRNILMAIGCLVLLCYTSPKLTAYVILLIPVVIVPLILIGRKVRGRSRLAQAAIGDLGAYLDETVHGMRTVQAYGQQNNTARHFTGHAEHVFQASRQYIGLRAVITAAAILIIFGGVSVVLWLGGHNMLQGEISPGRLSAFLFYAVVLASSVGALSEVYGALNHAAGAADRLTEILQSKPSLKTTSSIQALPLRPEGTLCFDKVTFNYPVAPQNNILQDLSFTVSAGTSVALVGPSGAGKTTVFQLVERFYDPSSGRITFDGVDIKTVPPEDIRQHIAMVSQDPVIFSSSVMDNIRFSKPEAEEHEVIAAAKAANADAFIRRLSHGYETLVGERGNRLSGGQKQRIAIARAILRDPAVLLLDEATSALDSESESKVQAALNAVMKDRTTLIIAHRLSTVQNVDEIMVLDNGQVVERGRHADLIRQDGLYKRYAEKQFDI